MAVVSQDRFHCIWLTSSKDLAPPPTHLVHDDPPQTGPQQHHKEHIGHVPETVDKKLDNGDEVNGDFPRTSWPAPGLQPAVDAGEHCENTHGNWHVVVILTLLHTVIHAERDLKTDQEYK